MRMVVYLYAPHLLAEVLQLAEPSLKGHPLAVVDGSRLLDVSWEAAALGLEAGASLHQARLACPALQVRPYRAQAVQAPLSHLWQALVPGSTAVEPDGWQGVFVERTLPFPEDGQRQWSQAGEALLELARRALPVRLVAGVGPNKLVAKAAALLQAGIEQARRSRPLRPGVEEGQGNVRAVCMAASFVMSLPIRYLWPLPGGLIEELLRLGFRSAGDLARVGPDALVRRFGPQGWLLWKLSQGIDSAPVLPVYPPPAVQRALDLESEGLSLRDHGWMLEQKVRQWALEVAGELQRMEQKAGRLSLALSLRAPSRDPQANVSPARAVSLGERRHHPQAMAELGARLFRRVVEEAGAWLQRGARPARLTLSALDLRPAAPRQATMLDNRPDRQRRERLRRALEAVRNQVGPGRMWTASQVPLPWREARLALLEQGGWLPR